MGIDSIKQNNTYIDSVKTVLIFFVILGHTIEKCKLGGFSNEIQIFNFILLFHMPMFLFVSGYLTHIKDRSHYWQGVLRILETFFVFDIIRILIDGNYSLASLASPKWTLWYLLTLAYYRCLAFACRKVCGKVLIISSIAISLVGGGISIGAALSFQRTLAFLPFFILGFVMSRDNIGIDWVRRIPKIVSILIVVASVVFFYSYEGSLVPLFAGSYPYSADSIVGTVGKCREFLNKLIDNVMEFSYI